MVTATMLTEAAGPLADRDYATLRAHAGAAPVTKRSGKRVFFVHMRYACKWRLRQALYHWSRISIQHDAARARTTRPAGTRSRSRPRAPERRGSMAPHSRRHAHNRERVRPLTIQSSGGCDRLTNGGESSHPRTFAPSHLRTLAPSHLRTLAPVQFSQLFRRVVGPTAERAALRAATTASPNATSVTSTTPAGSARR